MATKNKLNPVFKAINAVAIRPSAGGAGKRQLRDHRKQAEAERLMFELACACKLVEKRSEDGVLRLKKINMSAASTANAVTRLLSLGVSGDDLLARVPDIAARFPWQGCRDALYELAKHRGCDLTTVAIVFGLEDEGTKVVASEPEAAPAPAPAPVEEPRAATKRGKRAA